MNTELEETRHGRDDGNTATPSQPKAAPAHSSWDDEEEEKSAFQKYRLPVIAGIILATGIGFVAKSLSGKSSAPPPKQEVMIVHTLAQPTPSRNPRRRRPHRHRRRRRWRRKNRR